MAGRYAALAAALLGAMLLAWAARATRAPGRSGGERVAFVGGLVLALAGVAGAAVL
jgi:hypothetical protein